MRTSYNIIDEKFLSVKTNLGIEHFSLKDILIKAHNITEFFVPTIHKNNKDFTCYIDKFAMYRFFVNIIEDIYRFSSPDDIKDMFMEGYFLPDHINEYFQKYKQYYDLFDEEHPFMQQTISDFSKKDAPVQRIGFINPLIRTGQNDVFYNPIGSEREYEVTFEQVVPMLIRNNIFHSRMGEGWYAPLIGSMGNSPLYSLFKGNNLFETILLNCSTVTAGDKPGWYYSYLEKRNISLMNYEFYPMHKFKVIPDNGKIKYIMAESMSDKLLIPDDKIREHLYLNHPNILTFKYKKKDKTLIGYESADTKKEPIEELKLILTQDKAGKKYDSLVYLLAEDGIGIDLSVEFYGINIRNVPQNNTFYDMSNIPYALFSKEYKSSAINLISVIEQSGQKLIKRIEGYTCEAYNIQKPKYSMDYEEIPRLFYEKAKQYFMEVYIPNIDSLDVHKCYVDILRMASDVFMSARPMRRNLLLQAKYRADLEKDIAIIIKNIKKEEESCRRLMKL